MMMVWQVNKIALFASLMEIMLSYIFLVNQESDIHKGNQQILTMKPIIDRSCDWFPTCVDDVISYRNILVLMFTLVYDDLQIFLFSTLRRKSFFKKEIESVQPQEGCTDWKVPPINPITLKQLAFFAKIFVDLGPFYSREL